MAEHSYCKAIQYEGDARTYYKCDCIDGYKTANSNEPKCVPIKPCSHAGFNEEYNQLDCDAHQFCRRNVCQCGVGLHFSEYTDECVTINGYQPTQVGTQEYGCLPKVNLGRPCKHSQQCSSQNSHSHCSLSLSLDRRFCDCDVGFTAEPASGAVYACFEVDENLGESEPKRTTAESARISQQQPTQASKIKAEEEERNALLKERIKELKDVEIQRNSKKWSLLETASPGEIFAFGFVALAILFFTGIMAAREWNRKATQQRQGEYASIERGTAQMVVQED